MRLGASVSNTPGYVKTFYCPYPDEQKSGAALRRLLWSMPHTRFYKHRHMPLFAIND